RIIEEDGLVANVRAVGTVMLQELRKLADHPLVGEVRGEGLVAGVEVVASKAEKRKFDPYGALGTYIFKRAHAHGLIVRTMGDVVVFCPPMIIKADEVRDMV